MAKAVCHLDRTCDECMTSFECKAMMYAKRFYDAGYRKASEVAREICQDIIEPLWEAWSDSDSQSTVLLVAMILETINYQIKMKYLGGDTNVTTNTEEEK